MIKSVNDTNIWIAGINRDTGAGYLIRRHWEDEHFQHFISSEILFEIIRVLREVFAYPDDLLYDWYWLLLKGSIYVVPTTIVNAVEADPDDNKFLACALDGEARFIVSEDRHLRSLGMYDTIQVVRKQTFLALLEAEWGEKV
ncbi:MAG TPA: putative toxin-antitoxin system toxin component, PIN family [Chloroflexi bacterium]|nr:putative toxin-antitoxin system toxin component, PIN family [Chloroflexota bacterium]